MNTLLLFFALPIATIILAVVLERILKCPVLVAATFFAIYLILAFSVFDISFLVFAIVYTILSFIAAYLAELFCRKNSERRCGICCCRCNQNSNNTTNTLSNQDITRIANQLANIQQNNCNKQNNCNCSNDVATVNVTNNTTGGRTNWCCYRR